MLLCVACVASLRYAQPVPSHCGGSPFRYVWCKAFARSCKYIFLGVDVLCLQIFCFVLRLGLLDMKLLLQQFLFVLIRFIAAMLAVLLILAFIGAGMSVGVLIVYNLWF